MRRDRARSMNQINVVPYIDVMLVLLVIFMVTAPLINPGEIELPSVGSKLDRAGAAARSHAAQRQTLWLRDQQANTRRGRASRATSSSRASARSSAQAEQPVVIAADKNVRYEDVLALLDLLQRNGVKKVGLLARPPAT